MPSRRPDRLSYPEARVRRVLRKLTPDRIDFVALTDHLRSLPRRSDVGHNWMKAVLRFYDIGDDMREPECDFGKEVMEWLIGLGLFTQLHSRHARRMVLQRFAKYDPPTAKPSYAMFGWYRRH